MTYKSKNLLVACLATMPWMLTMQLARSQPAPNAPQAVAPQEKRDFEAWSQEIDQVLQESRKSRARLSLGSLGVESAEVQEAVLILLEQQHLRVQPLNMEAARLARFVGSVAATDAQVETMLAALQKNLVAERAARAQALEALDAKIGYTKSPSVEMALTMLSLTGDEAAVIDGVPLALSRLGVGSNSLLKVLDDLGMVDEQARQGIIRFVVEQERELSPLLGIVYRVPFLKFRSEPERTEAERAALRELRLAVSRHKIKRAGALEKLDAKIGYERSPRLRATLFLLGISSDDVALLDGVNMRGIISFGRFTSLLTGKPVKFD